MAGAAPPATGGIRMAGISDIDHYVRSLGPNHAQSLLALYVSPKSCLLGASILARRGETGRDVEPVEVVGNARGLGAMGFILVHYDPARVSGPNDQELRLARELRRLGEDCDIYLLHYLIIGKGRVREIAA